MGQQPRGGFNNQPYRPSLRPMKWAMVRDYTSLPPWWVSLLPGMGPVPWPDSTGRFEAWRRAVRRKVGRYLGREGHACFCGPCTQTRRERPPQTYALSGCSQGRSAGGDRKCGQILVFRGVCVCVIVAHFSLPLGNQPFRHQTVGPGGCHRLLDSHVGGRLTSGNVSMKWWMLASLAARTISSCDTTRLLSP